MLELNRVSKRYDAPGEQKVTVLQDIDLRIGEGEFVAILGPSGSGKSTLLRIIAGLVPATSGTVSYLGRPISDTNPGVSMVFQSFALFPWLTVLENVELGLRYKDMSAQEKRNKALSVIDMIGLDGFEGAYPKELSGGMRQRVGLGRALVMEPDVLLMDEPFSALDVLTAENLRRDLLELWLEKKIPTKSIIMVTHGIEEAVYMADRAVVLSRDPATVIADIKITLPHWRERKDEAFTRLVDRIYSILTHSRAAQEAVQAL
ncbi:MAG: ABC transporter ATP-binding protein, partial [Alicyclobacillus sp.]|nr:ABC transporter ATP-binding protein [Alicyclobacillus sp.]